MAKKPKKKTPDQPTPGNCYEDAFMVQMQLPQAILVHGIPRGQGKIEGLRYGHAWVEVGDIVLDAVAGVIPKREYYEIGAIEYTVRYSREEAHLKALETGVYGPWDEKISKAFHRKD